MTVLEKQLLAVVASPESHRVKELQRRIAELTAAIAARDTFIAVAAHELRNPMTPIVGQLEFLLSTIRAGRCSPELVQPRLERIQHTIRRYVKRAGVLLDVSQLTNGKRQLELEPFSLAALLHDVAGEFADEARCAGVPITVTAPNTLSGTWDRLALEQIIDNLVSNALKYGARTPIELSAETCGKQVRIQVRDHGNGIAVGDRERVFGRFERAVGRGERRSGFGVGLWVVCQLVQAMDGAVAVENAADGGALFTITLPQHVNGKRA